MSFVMPLPLPKPPSATGIVDLHYMPFEDEILHPFTVEHQSSLHYRRRVNNSAIGSVAHGNRETMYAPKSDQNKLAQGRLVRGDFTCKDYLKPRCIYSATAPSRMKTPTAIGDADPTTHTIHLCREYTIQKLEDAQVSEMYVCGMQPFDADNLMYGVIVARDGLDCHHPMEFEYFNNPKMVTTWFNARLCAYCAGSSGAQVRYH